MAKVAFIRETGEVLGLGIAVEGGSYREGFYRAMREAEVDACGRKHGQGILSVRRSVVTGYGRRTMLFPKSCVRPEIVCHSQGASFLFPGTRTLLDIGGQDMKVARLDDTGRILGFQMNDRCAAGCGRFLTYLSDELGLEIGEMGAQALQAVRPARIDSTCTVFAGLELRTRLAQGERREDLLLGLHRAVALKAMSLVWRSGGIIGPLTVTGGVSRNVAVMRELRSLIAEKFGDIGVNCDSTSIFAGAVGAAILARQEFLRLDASKGTTSRGVREEARL